MIGRRSVQWIDAAHSLKVLWVPLQYARQITVVIAVMDHLDNDGPGHAVRLHETEQRLRRGVALGRTGLLGEGEFGIVLPYVHMRIDDAVIGGKFGGAHSCLIQESRQRSSQQSTPRQIIHKSVPAYPPRKRRNVRNWRADLCARYRD